MKKILGILIVLLLITVTACDDGEMTVKTFNFTGEVAPCGTVANLYIKNSGTEVLLMDLSTHPLLNIASELDESGVPIPAVVNLPAGAVIYRNYSANASASVVCSNIDNPAIYVMEEWKGSGTIEIITTKLDVPETTGLIQYSHSITFLDVSLTKGDETIRIQNTDYGSVETSLSFEFRFASGDEVNPTQLTACGDFLYDTAGNEALLLNFADNTISNTVDETIINLDAATNYLTLKVYTGTVTGISTICTGNPSLTPTEKERWVAATGRVKIKKIVDSSNVPHYDIYLYDDIRFYNITTSAVALENFTPEPTDADADGDYYYLGQYTP
ncbi:hypothetical protein ACLI09_17230 [Flavobacterium sp. RHBU_24]|uniref:hypothetical protein n=1 Tax=Flavobacterium sp. RHBU_24 TaxID=3391185 RepID=UPI0039855B81